MRPNDAHRPTSAAAAALPILTSLRFFAAAEVVIFHFGRMTDVDLVTWYFGNDLTSFPVLSPDCDGCRA